MAKALSVTNPISYLICTGIKTVENRTWSTEYRGRLYIHSSGSEDFSAIEGFSEKFLKKMDTLEKIAYLQDVASFGEARNLLDEYGELEEFEETLNSVIQIDNFCKMLEDYYGCDYLARENYRKIKNKGFFCKHSAIIGYVDLVDIIKDSKSVWAEKNCYHWILRSPVLLTAPILNIKGKLRLFEFDLE